jgi:hypothetical protein
VLLVVLCLSDKSGGHVQDVSQALSSKVHEMFETSENVVC